MNFEDVDVPKATRTSLPNPFRDVVKTMTVGGKAKTGPVPYLDSDDETAERAQNRVDRQLTELGDEVNATIRRTFAPATADTKHTVTFWLVTKRVTSK